MARVGESKLAELEALGARSERMRRALATAMRCGCLRIEDCEFDESEGCTLLGPVTIERGAHGDLAKR